MPWDTSTRKSTLPRDWAHRRLRVLQRQLYMCRWILSTNTTCDAYATDVDHIIPHSQGGSDDESNLQSLCRFHHLKKSSAEGAAARKPRPSRKRVAETHPGVIG